MIWQAYVDESIDNGLFVLAGYLATAESWAAFARDWAKMLPHGIVGADGIYRFKMSEMAKLPERIERVPGFYRVIEKHVAMGLSMTLKVQDFVQGKKRLLVMNQWGQPVPVSGEVYENIYLFTFTRLMNLFHQNRGKSDFQNLLPIDQKVDFIFDERSEKKAILNSWEEFLSGNEFRRHYGAIPRFENDDAFLPLQAADFIAWWTRQWARDNLQNFSDPFPWKPSRPMHFIRASMSEDHVFQDLSAIVKKLRPDRRIFDRNDLINISLGSAGRNPDAT